MLLVLLVLGKHCVIYCAVPVIPVEGNVAQHLTACFYAEKETKMGIINKLFGSSNAPSRRVAGAIDYGRTKKNGGHDHTHNRGDDQTPAQKKGHEQAQKTKAENKASKA